MATNPQEFCNVASGACLNPPGFRRGDGAAFPNGTGKRTRWRCPYCGLPACKADRAAIHKGKKIVVWCANCTEDEARFQYAVPTDDTLSTKGVDVLPGDAV